MKTLALIAALAAAAAPGFAAKHDHSAHGAAPGGPTTVSGEILDLNCYMAHEGKGEKHKKCAKMCAQKGAPLGLLDEKGTVHLLVANHDNEKPMKTAQELAGEKVKVSGSAAQRGGLSAIVLSSVEKAK